MLSISLTWSFFHCHLLPIAVTLIPPSYHTEMLLSSCKMPCVILSSQGDCTHCFLTKALSILYSLTIYFIVYIQHWSASSIKHCGYLPIRVFGLAFTKCQNVSGIAHAFFIFLSQNKYIQFNYTYQCYLCRLHFFHTCNWCPPQACTS